VAAVLPFYRAVSVVTAAQNEVSIMTESKIPLLALASILAFSSALALADETTQARLHAEAKISEADARTTALATVPGGSVASSELEKEHASSSGLST